MSVQTLIQDIPSPKQEKWKYSNLPGALRGMEILPAPAVWDMTGAFEFLDPELVWTPQTS